jgi:hypothetical protein
MFFFTNLLLLFIMPADDSAAQDGQLELGALRRLPGHALVLAAHSEFFKAALSQRWCGEGKGKVYDAVHKC